MNVLLIRAEKRKTAQTTPGHGQADIDNRQGQREGGCDQSRCDIALVGIHDGKRADEKTEEISAAIAHIDFRRRIIELEKADERARHADGKKHRVAEIIGHAQVGHEQHEHETDAAREAIDAVDQIDKIGEADEPQGR